MFGLKNKELTASGQVTTKVSAGYQECDQEIYGR